MTHWDMFCKENSSLVALFNVSQTECVFCSPVWRFLNHELAQLQMAHPLYLTSRRPIDLWRSSPILLSVKKMG